MAASHVLIQPALSVFQLRRVEYSQDFIHRLPDPRRQEIFLPTTTFVYIDIPINYPLTRRKFSALVCIAAAMPSDKLEKKRKRASDPHERPSKKPALELRALPPLAASLIEDKSELAPVIGE